MAKVNLIPTLNSLSYVILMIDCIQLSPFLKKGGMNDQDKKFASEYLSPYESFENFVKHGLNKKKKYCHGFIFAHKKILFVMEMENSL